MMSIVFHHRKRCKISMKWQIIGFYKNGKYFKAISSIEASRGCDQKTNKRFSILRHNSKKIKAIILEVDQLSQIEVHIIY